MSSSRKHNAGKIGRILGRIGALPKSYIITKCVSGKKMTETSTSSSGLSSASVGLSCESSSDATTSFSVVNVLERLKVPRLVLCLQCYMDCAFS